MNTVGLLQFFILDILSFILKHDWKDHHLFAYRRFYVKNNILVRFFILITLSILFTPSLLATSKIPVFVSILPQKYFVKKIGGTFVDANVMVSPGASPHTFEPKPSQMVALTKSKLYFAIGVEFERIWLEKFAATNPEMVIVHMDQGIEKIPMSTFQHGDEADTHSEGGDHQDQENHEHGALDPHIWLSPSLVKQQAKIILEVLQDTDPLHQKEYQVNYQRLIDEIADLDGDLKNTFQGKEGLQFIVFHPSWGYFARDYHLKQIPIEIEGKNPKPAQLKELIKHAREYDIRVIFVQPQFSQRSAGLIAKEIKGEVIKVDPLVEDWGTNMKNVAASFKKALK
ncbi:zinc ABC transporter substrate-binding protein [bacterium]|nr:zinc ABC transporter substrate-binding protein [bacterium]